MDGLPLDKLNTVLNRLIKEGRNKWPSPVAVRLEGLGEEETGERVLSVLAFLDSLAAFLGSVLISIYLNDPDKKFESKNFNQGVFDFLSRPPTLGQWVGIIREGIKYFKEQPDFFMPELLEFGEGIKDPRKHYY